MEVEINKLKSQLYNASQITDSALKKQSEKYEQHISILNTEIANLNLKLE